VTSVTANPLDDYDSTVTKSGAGDRLTVGYHESVAIVEHTEQLLSLTPGAAAKIRGLQSEEPAGEAEVLRVAIQGGGCSGFQYGLGFDSGAAEGDVELELEGVRVVVDPFSAPYLRGVTIDYLEGLQESGFKIENPNAVSSCGCGHSFQVEDAEADPYAGPGCGSGCG
jgi:iron-sulfur cluster assembly protein